MFFKQSIFLFLLIINSSQIIFAQDKGYGSRNTLVQEEVFLTTDRTLYFSGERILFKANRIISNLHNDTLLSTVLYLELYDQKDKPIVQRKEQIVNGESSGSIEIPADVVTGNYFLRTYTQYMRNFKPEIYYTTQVTIINPELPAKEVIETVKHPKDTAVKSPDTMVEIITSKEIFPPRSLITIDLKGKENANVSVSVVKRGSYEEDKTGINKYFKPASEVGDTTANVKWYPEIRSVSISGKVIDKKTGAPLKNTLVYASIIDNGKQFHVVRTKKNGEFVFSLPNLNEKNKIYICVQKQEDQEVAVLINQDFSSDFLQLEYAQENIDSNKIRLVDEMYVNYQVAKEYNNNIEIKKTFLDTLPDPFAEKYENTILTDYVDLPEMTDIFNEIIPYTHVKKSGKKVSIQAFDKTDKTIFPHPLILLDGIPFQDDSALLSLSPSKIISVGIIAQPFVHGSEKIYGIINIKSVDGNLGGLQLPKDLVAVDYITFSPLTSQQYKDYKKESYAENRNPDFRNTMYWNPSVVLKSGKATLQFYSSDYSSDYEIVVRGMDESGKLIFSTKTIRIDNSKR